MDGWINVWMDGWMNVRAKPHVFVTGFARNEQAAARLFYKPKQTLPGLQVYNTQQVFHHLTAQALLTNLMVGRRLNDLA